MRHESPEQRGSLHMCRDRHLKTVESFVDKPANSRWLLEPVQTSQIINVAVACITPCSYPSANILKSKPSQYWKNNNHSIDSEPGERFVWLCAFHRDIPWEVQNTDSPLGANKPANPLHSYWCSFSVLGYRRNVRYHMVPSPFYINTSPTILSSALAGLANNLANRLSFPKYISHIAEQVFPTFIHGR